jgi:hypothetical protein
LLTGFDSGTNGTDDLGATRNHGTTSQHATRRARMG